ncbi:MAG TPA: DUF4190 domain-containing protein [Bellilinea sp.]|nr:DUF4190 domain-containing protein [Bellilinea sp.]
MSELPSLPVTKPYHSMAIVSLVPGILSLAVILPVIGSIGAVISGRIARREIAENPDQFNGDNLARAGVILGWIGIGLSALVLVVLCGFVLFFIPLQMRTTN